MDSTTGLGRWLEGRGRSTAGLLANRFLSKMMDEETAATPPTVFVVEPDVGAQRSLAWILRSAGFDVVEYHSGEDFLGSLDNDCPGCLLVNLHLPGMSGVSVLEELGRRGLSMPVILLTGYGEAMAAGLPVAGWHAGNLPNLANDGVHGVVVEPGDVRGLADGLRRLASDEPWRAKLAAAARRRADDFPTWSHSADELFAALRQLVRRCG